MKNNFLVLSVLYQFLLFVGIDEGLAMDWMIINALFFWAAFFWFFVAETWFRNEEGLMLIFASIVFFVISAISSVIRLIYIW